MNDSDVTRRAHEAARILRADRARGEREFQQLLHEFPDDGMVYFQRAQALEGIGALDEAAGDYSRAAGLLKYPSWIGKARESANRLRQRHAEVRAATPSGGNRGGSITAQELERAAVEFRAREPRAVVYDAAQVLLEAAIEDYEHLSPVVAIAALIQSWNFAYYKNTSCDAGHIVDLELALHGIWAECVQFRRRDIASFDRTKDRSSVDRVFSTFERVLGRVGAPKAMHLIAPSFFPLWDNFIAPAYGIDLGPVGQNTDGYLAFMEIAKQQAAEVRAVLPSRRDVLKVIDEYNYCRYSKRWI